MKKIVFGLHILLAFLIFFYFNSLNSFPNRVPAENIRLDRFATQAPPTFQLSLLENYPKLFNVKLSDRTTQNTGNDGAEDVFLTGEGRLRVRGIFIMAGRRLALVEINAGSSSELIKVRKNDVLKGYRVLAVEPKNISLQKEDNGNILKLIIFKQDENKDRP